MCLGRSAPDGTANSIRVDRAAPARAPRPRRQAFVAIRADRLGAIHRHEAMPWIAKHPGVGVGAVAKLIDAIATPAKPDTARERRVGAKPLLQMQVALRASQVEFAGQAPQPPPAPPLPAPPLPAALAAPPVPPPAPPLPAPPLPAALAAPPVPPPALPPTPPPVPVALLHHQRHRALPARLRHHRLPHSRQSQRHRPSRLYRRDHSQSYSTRQSPRIRGIDESAIGCGFVRPVLPAWLLASTTTPTSIPSPSRAESGTLPPHPATASSRSDAWNTRRLGRR